VAVKDSNGNELVDGDTVECGQGRNTLVLKTCFLKKA
jgi:uncharacterized Zn ribbon protein